MLHISIQVKNRTRKNAIKARIKVSRGHIGWADLIFVMEKKHLRRLQERFNDILSQKKVICLNIADDYQFMDRELVELLIATVSEHIELPGLVDD